MGEAKRSLQYGLGGDFAETPALNGYCEKLLTSLSDIDSYTPLAMPALIEGQRKEGVISRLTVRGHGTERELTVLPDLTSFEEYCDRNRVRGMLFVVPGLSLGKISPASFETLQRIFEGLGEVTNPKIFRIWFAEEGVIPEPVSGNKIKGKKQFVEEMGLCGVEYHHPRGGDIAWFEARPHKKRQMAETDISGDERIRFLERWMNYIVEYRGGKVISKTELEEKLRHSKSRYMDAQKIGDEKGISSEEKCGCLVRTDMRGEMTIVHQCGEESCFQSQKSRDSKNPFLLGEEYSVSKCADCGGARTTKAYWADIDKFDPQRGIRIAYEVVCKNHDGHSRKDSAWVDPARILNPMYIYNCLHPKNTDSKAA